MSHAPEPAADLSRGVEAGRAAGVLMALVPCTAAVAYRILGRVTETTGVTRDAAVRAVLAMYRGSGAAAEPPAACPVERAVRAEMERARTSPPPVTPPALFPAASVLRQHLNHLRAARRRAMNAPHDPALRAQLEDSLYALCVLTGRRSAHAALLAAEQYLAVHRQVPACGPARPG